MRFFSDGPSFPDLLLERRDLGRVVFLCGAGVSLNAGMPTFVGLTQHVVDFFDPPEGSAIASSFGPWVDAGYSGPRTPLDQIFHLLYQEYGRDDVNALVAERLREGTQRDLESREHELIARISSDQDGNPQIVTTNFDRLFEEVVGVETQRIHEPPAFPDIRLGVPITGLTYLHGRLQDPDTKHHPYVLSSADFGRAYLSEGWATNFIRSLLDSYTVVLVGYQAEDPPVRYLLQGLNEDGISDRSNLYAFDKGLPEEIEAKWRDRGVTAIAYNDHPDLWQSLTAWAERADDPRAWRSKVVDLARRGPREVAAHERGQVVHLVRTTPGARLLANADPSPTVEWLCVFDAYCRAAKKGSAYGENAEVFDPLEVYGLDDDPPRPTESGRQSHLLHDHLLEWRHGDANPPIFHQLAGRQVEGFEDMPPRLRHLVRWIIKHVDSPVAAWWALRQNGLHPRLANEIRQELKRGPELHPKARRYWNLILECQFDHRTFALEHGWIDLADRIKKEGWSQSVVRAFETMTSPILSRSLPLGLGATKPPFEDWENTSAEELTRWEVKFPDRPADKIEIPDQVLETVFRIIESHLFRASALFGSLDTNYLTSPTCYPDRDIDGDIRHRNRDVVFRWFLDLFARMLERSPATLRAHAVTWPEDDKYFFRKFKLFALNHSALFNADEAAEAVLGLDKDVFWDTEVRRELLFLIHDRWAEISEPNRITLADRLLGGPSKKGHWSDGEYARFKNEFAARYTRWLTLQGLKLSSDQTNRLDEMISGLPEWNDRWASSVVTEHGIHSGWVGTDETPDVVADLPVSKVVERAKADLQRDLASFTDKRPFTGLVKTNPRKALASLSHSARLGDYPQQLWTALIQEWPNDPSPRLYRVFLHRLGRLPEEVIRELRHTIGRWIEQNFVSALEYDTDLAWDTFDHLVSSLVSGDGSSTESGIGEIRAGDDVVGHSRRTFDHAINGPIGEATLGWVHALNSLKLPQRHGIPEEFKSRVESLLTAPGEGSDHAVAILTNQISWLHYLDPNWVVDRIMPWFNFEHSVSEPAWNGYLSAARFPPRELGIRLKPMILQLFPEIYRWSWHHDLAEVAAQMAVELAILRRDEPDGLNRIEARQCLRNLNDQGRQFAVIRLSHIGQREENGWENHVIPFIEEVWPRERIFRTSSLVSSWIGLLEDTDGDFPNVLKSARRFLVPVELKSFSLYRFAMEIGDKEPLTVKHPEAVLEMMEAIIPHNPEAIPSELAQILDLIEETDPSLTRDRRFMRLIDLAEMN